MKRSHQRVGPKKYMVSKKLENCQCCPSEVPQKKRAIKQKEKKHGGWFQHTCWNTTKCARPPAKGVSEPRQQSLFPVHPTINSSIRRGGPGSGCVGSRIAILLFGRSKIGPEIDPVVRRFLKPKWSQNPSQNH